MNKRVISITSAILGVVLIGSTVSYFTIGHTKKTETPVTQTTVAKSPSTPTVHLISLQARQQSVSSKQASKYKAIPVLSATGTKKTLDVNKTPVVFVTDMDTTILKQFAGQHFTKPPTIVVAWPKTKETTAAEITNVENVEKSLKLTEPVVALDGKATTWATGMPDTYVTVNGKLEEIPGILASNEVDQWATVFN